VNRGAFFKVLLLSSSILLVTLLAMESAAAANAARTVKALNPSAQSVYYPDQRDSVEQAVNWLVTTHQNQDGGYSSFSMGADLAASDVAGTLDAILAISAAGFNPAAPLDEGANSPIDFLTSSSEELEAYAGVDGAQAAKIILALVASNQNPRDFTGDDFVSILLGHYSFSGQFGVETPFGHSLAILALSAAHEPVPEAAVTWLISRQAVEGDVSGSWDDGFGTEGNADATAMALMALVSTGTTSTLESQASGYDFLARTRLDGGGWEYAAGLGENANSTALAVQALSAAGLDLEAVNAEGISVINALLAWQSESGAFQVDFGDGRFDDFFSTVQALPAATGRALPLPGRFQAALRAVDCLVTLQDPASGGWEQFATFGVNAAGTSRAIQAITAVGEDPNASKWTVGDVTAVQALENGVPDFAATSGGGGLGVLMQGVVAAGGDVHDFGSTNLALSITQHLSPTGEYDDTSFGPFSHAEAMLGLLSAGLEVDPTAVDWLLSAHDNGDWGGADSTGISMNVLARLGIILPDSLDVLRNSQELDGGWGFGSANPNSSSEVVQGLVVAGENPFAPAWSKVISGTLSNAADAILRQQGHNGCWPNLFGPGDDPFATTDAVLLLVQQPGWESLREITPAVPTLVEGPGNETPTPVATLGQPMDATEIPVPANTPTVRPTVQTSATAFAAENGQQPIPTAEPTSKPIAAQDGPAGTTGVPAALIIAAAVIVIGGAGYLYWSRTRV